MLYFILLMFTFYVNLIVTLSKSNQIQHVNVTYELNSELDLSIFSFESFAFHSTGWREIVRETYPLKNNVLKTLFGALKRILANYTFNKSVVLIGEVSINL